MRLSVYHALLRVACRKNVIESPGPPRMITDEGFIEGPWPSIMCAFLTVLVLL
jgi:hypothetical protein